MLPSNLTQPPIVLIFALNFVCYTLLFAQESSSADAETSAPPPVFQPGETQHGFSEFDSIPEIPSDENTPSSSEVFSEPEAGSSHNPDQKPSGLFFQIEFAEGFEEAQGLRRGHMIVPIKPRDVFSPEIRAVFLVFSVFKHHAPYQVFGSLYPEKVDNQDPSHLLDEDTMYLAAEDESGYLQFFPQTGSWAPGVYQVKIFVGWETSAVNHMGTMRFRITSDSSLLLPSSR